MRHFVTCLAFVAGLIVGNVNVAEAGGIINQKSFDQCMEQIVTIYEGFSADSAPSAFTFDFSHPNVEKYDCDIVYDEFIRKGKNNRNPVARAMVEKLTAARSAGLIDDLRESQTTGCGRYCFSPPKEIHMREDDPIPCIRSDGAIYQRPRGSTESCPAGFHEAN